MNTRFSVGWGTALQAGMSRVLFTMVLSEMFNVLTPYPANVDNMASSYQC